MWITWWIMKIFSAFIVTDKLFTAKFNWNIALFYESKFWGDCYYVIFFWLKNCFAVRFWKRAKALGKPVPSTFRAI